MSKVARGRPRKHEETSPKSRRKERNSQRIYLGDLASRWAELKTAVNLTDIQLARHLLDIHDITCQCNCKTDQQCDPWDRSSQQECLQLPSVSTPQKNRDLDIASQVADLSMISSLMSSPTAICAETCENAEECYNDHCRDEPDDLSPTTDTLDETVNRTRHTGILETFHNHLLMYCSKRQSYQFPGYRARNLLAAIDYNHHVNRPDHLDQSGEARQKPRFNKRSKTWSVAPVKINKAYSYKYDIQCMVFEEKAKDPLPTNRRAPPREDDPRRISRTIAKVACPPKSELMEKQKSRF